MADVSLHRILGNIQVRADLQGRLTAGEKAQYLQPTASINEAPRVKEV